MIVVWHDRVGALRRFHETSLHLFPWTSLSKNNCNKEINHRKPWGEILMSITDAFDFSFSICAIPDNTVKQLDIPATEFCETNSPFVVHRRFLKLTQCNVQLLFCGERCRNPSRLLT